MHEPSASNCDVKVTSQTVPSRFDLYPGCVLTESGTFFFRSNSRWYGCCDWLLVPGGVSLDSYRAWTDSWCADLLPRNKRIHSRNKRIHSRNKCIQARKTALLSRLNIFYRETISSALEYISTAIETSSIAKQKHSSAKHSPSFAPQYFLSRNN